MTAPARSDVTRDPAFADSNYRVLRVLRRLDWPDWNEMLIALECAPRSTDDRRYHQSMTRMLARGLVERRRAPGGRYEYRAL